MIAHNTRDPKSNCGTCPKRITYTRMVRLSHNILENSTKSMQTEIELAISKQTWNFVNHTIRVTLVCISTYRVAKV